MSAADLFEDGFPHGTPAGYTDGCKSGACPGKADFGMSCRMAWQAERSDRRYRRLADEGFTPAAIAVELGFVEPEQLSTSAAVELAAWRVKSTGVSTEQMLDAARTVFLETSNAADVARDLSRPARIRAWALDQGLTVGDKGPIRRAVIEAYDASHDEQPVQGPAAGVQFAHNGLTHFTGGVLTIEGSLTTDALVPEHTEHDTLPRPDFGQAMVDVDVERARRIAVHLEQELARTEELLEASRIETRTALTALDHEIQLSASAQAEAAALRRALADRARRGRGVVAWVRRVVAR